MARHLSAEHKRKMREGRERAYAARHGFVHERGETVYANSAGEAVAPGKLGHLRADISAHVPVEFDGLAIGALLDGFFGAMRSVVAPDLSAMYPDEEMGDGVHGPGPHDEASHARQRAVWQRLAQEREVGRQLWKHIGMAMLHNNVTDAEFIQALVEVERGRLSQATLAAPPVPQRAQVIGLGRSRDEKGFVSPIMGPARILGRYDEDRQDDKGNRYKHRGIDIGAAIGAPVFSVEQMKILKISEDPQLGRYIQAGLKTEDGTSYAGTSNYWGIGNDDPGTVVIYGHLGDILVQEGQEVARGQPIAAVGSSGLECSAGCIPQLHFETHKLYQGQDLGIDPLVFVPEKFITHETTGDERVTTGQPRAGSARVNTPQGPAQAVAIVAGDQTMINVGSGTQTSVNADIRVPVGNFGGQGPSDFINQFSQVGPPSPGSGRGLVEGLGSLAGQFFELVGNPQLANVGANLMNAGGNLMQGAGAAMTAGSGLLASLLNITAPMASVGSVPAASIPYVGGVASGLLQAYGATAPVVAPMYGVGGGVVGGMTSGAGMLLSKGAQGGAVQQVQQAINNSFGQSVLPVDGKFGPQTEAAVKQFQARAGLRADGIVGPATLAKLGVRAPQVAVPQVPRP